MPDEIAVLEKWHRVHDRCVEEGVPRDEAVGIADNTCHRYSSGSLANHVSSMLAEAAWGPFTDDSMRMRNA